MATTRTVLFTLPLAGHDANHPLLIDPNPLMHLLGTALIHYAIPKACAMAFAQPYSFKTSIKKFGQDGKMAAVTE
jgi:hypothetical protein